MQAYSSAESTNFAIANVERASEDCVCDKTKFFLITHTCVHSAAAASLCSEYVNGT